MTSRHCQEGTGLLVGVRGVDMLWGSDREVRMALLALPLTCSLSGCDSPLPAPQVPQCGLRDPDLGRAPNQ